MSQIYGASEPERLEQLQHKYIEAYGNYLTAKFLERVTGEPAGSETYKQMMLDAHSKAQKLREGLS